MSEEQNRQTQTTQPVGYVVWLPRSRTYIGRDACRADIPTLDHAKLFTDEYSARRAAEQLGYPSKDGISKEPFEINGVGLRLLDPELR